MQLRSLVLMLALAPAATTAAQAAPQEAQAPDGERGFGLRPKLQEVSNLFRNPRGEDEHFVQGLLDLEGEVSTSFALIRARYARLGYLCLLSSAPDDLDQLHQAYRTMGQLLFLKPFPPDVALAYARMVRDVRYHLRSELHDAWLVDGRELRGALRLLQASASGVANIQKGGELGRITERADLAAARLRALRLDLSALHEKATPDTSVLPSAEVFELAALIERGDDAGQVLLKKARSRATRMIDRMRADLFITRLQPKVATALARRAEGVANARRVVAELLMLLPFTKEGRQAPPSIAKLSNTQRCKRALRTANEGLFQDPFHPLLNFLAGEAVDYSEGVRYSRAYFDRFLALRGLRYYEYSSFGWRHLEDRELRALERVVSPPIEPGRGR